jgi:hypothetical protein
MVSSCASDVCQIENRPTFVGSGIRPQEGGQSNAYTQFFFDLTNSRFFCALANFDEAAWEVELTLAKFLVKMLVRRQSHASPIHLPRIVLSQDTSARIINVRAAQHEGTSVQCPARPS